MKVLLHRQFKKSFKKRIAPNPKPVARFTNRLMLFIEDYAHPELRTHDLVGKKIHLKAFSITGDIRVVYIQEEEDVVLFLDIGTHSQVY